MLCDIAAAEVMIVLFVCLSFFSDGSNGQIPFENTCIVYQCTVDVS